MDYNVHKICRVCLEEGAQTSIYNTEFAMMPAAMMMLCAKIRVYKTDGLPSMICTNCIYRLGVAYHFKQECENSDIRLRQYLGLPDRGYGYCDAATNTDQMTKAPPIFMSQNCSASDDDVDHTEADGDTCRKKNKRRSRYQRKPPEEHKKRGPKPIPKLPQTCYDCQKSFKCAAQLAQHIRTHTGEKPYACGSCPQRFAQKYNLKVHERVHSGDKPFQCEVCSKQFSALGNFQAHQKIHTGIRDQLCPVCQKAFYTSGDLTKHMVTHSGLKNHHCDVCGKAFTRQRDMRAHKRKFHAEPSVAPTNNADDEDEIINDDDEDDEAIDTDPVGVDTLVHAHFKCPDCERAFDSADNLTLHFRTHTNLLNLPPLAPPSAAPPPPTMSHPLATHHHAYHFYTAPQAPPPPPPPATGDQGRFSMLHHQQRLHY